MTRLLAFLAGAAVGAWLATPRRWPELETVTATFEPDPTLRLVREHRWSVNALAKVAEHVTDGRPCWCDPEVKHVEGGEIIIHRRAD